MKRIFLILIGWGLLVQFGLAAQGPKAVLYRTEGRGALRVFLIQNHGDELTIRLENGRSNTEIPVSEVERLEMDYPEYDKQQVQQDFNDADYTAVIQTLEPVARAAGDYMSISNNVEDSFALLMKAYFENGDLDQAQKAAGQLLMVQNEDLKSLAEAYQALAVLESGDVNAASELLGKISDPAARIYVQARIEKAEGEPQAAIQTAVKLFASHPNDMNWMPQNELLCAQLYLELGMTNSAAAVARQTQKLYAGMNVEKKAQALRLSITESMEQPEE